MVLVVWRDLLASTTPSLAAYRAELCTVQGFPAPCSPFDGPVGCPTVFAPPAFRTNGGRRGGRAPPGGSGGKVDLRGRRRRRAEPVLRELHVATGAVLVAGSGSPKLGG